jgi:hypothetical protein
VTDDDDYDDDDYDDEDGDDVDEIILLGQLREGP